jgi:cytochrome c oxidase subunit 2
LRLVLGDAFDLVLPRHLLDVNGRQSWWEVLYRGDKPSDEFTTAKEIHIPVGVPILVGLHGGDCHS